LSSERCSGTPAASREICVRADLYLNVSFIQMLKAGTPVVLMLMLYFSGVSLMVKVTPRLALSVVAMFAGVVIASLGEVRLTMLGLVAMFLSEVSAGVRCILEEWLLTKMEPKMGVLEALYHLAPACVLSQAVVAAVLHLQLMNTGPDGKDPQGLFKPFAFNPEERQWFCFLVGCSCALGIAVNTGSLLVTQSYSSLFMKSVVIVRNIGLVVWGVAWYGEAVTAVELIGYAVTLTCFAWYNYEHQLAKASKSKDEDSKKSK
jgi:drug/metabolite transporter (DMT)-like permease